MFTTRPAAHVQSLRVKIIHQLLFALDVRGLHRVDVHHRSNNDANMASRQLGLDGHLDRQ